MKKGKAFVVVGHENWGKSKTLFYFTNENKNVRNFIFLNKNFFIRRTSNDDIPYGQVPKSYLKFIERNCENIKPFIIITLCPDFINKNKETVKVLKMLKAKYDLYFFILLYKYGNGRRISESEISELRKYGIVEILSDRDVEAEIRAEKLKEFLKMYS